MEQALPINLNQAQFFFGLDLVLKKAGIFPILTKFQNIEPFFEEEG